MVRLAATARSSVVEMATAVLARRRGGIAKRIVLLSAFIRTSEESSAPARQSWNRATRRADVAVSSVCVRGGLVKGCRWRTSPTYVRPCPRGRELSAATINPAARGTLFVEPGTAVYEGITVGGDRRVRSITIAAGGDSRLIVEPPHPAGVGRQAARRPTPPLLRRGLRAQRTGRGHIRRRVCPRTTSPNHCPCSSSASAGPDGPETVRRESIRWWCRGSRPVQRPPARRGRGRRAAPPPRARAPAGPAHRLRTGP